MDQFLQGSQATVDINFRTSDGGPFIDPPDARFDVLDPNNIVMASDVPTTIILSPGRHKGVYAVPEDAFLGIWTMRFKATINGNTVSEDCFFEVVDVPVAQEPGSVGPCSLWPLDYDCCTFPDAATPALIKKWRQVATNLLWRESGQIYGTCDITLRPCLRSCADIPIGWGGAPWVPMQIGGRWVNVSTCSCGSDCSCSELCEIKLPGPVAEVTTVTIGATVVTDWRLDRVGDDGMLVRTGNGCWPTCQDMKGDVGDDDTFTVVYKQGIPVPADGIAAVSELTCELVKSCIPGCECRLPKNVQSKNRSGVNITFDTSKSWLYSLPMVNLWLSSVNPSKLMKPLRVMSPDARPMRRMT